MITERPSPTAASFLSDSSRKSSEQVTGAGPRETAEPNNPPLTGMLAAIRKAELAETWPEHGSNPSFHELLTAEINPENRDNSVTTMHTNPVFAGDTEDGDGRDEQHGGADEMPDSLQRQIAELGERVEQILSERNNSVVHSVELQRQQAALKELQRETAEKLEDSHQKLAAAQELFEKNLRQKDARIVELEARYGDLQEALTGASQSIATINASLDAKQLPKFSQLRKAPGGPGGRAENPADSLSRADFS